MKHCLRFASKTRANVRCVTLNEKTYTTGLSDNVDDWGSVLVAQNERFSRHTPAHSLAINCCIYSRICDVATIWLRHGKMSLLTSQKTCTWRAIVGVSGHAQYTNFVFGWPPFGSRKKIIVRKSKKRKTTYTPDIDKPFMTVVYSVYNVRYPGGSREIFVKLRFISCLSGNRVNP